MWILVKENLLNLSYPAWGYLIFSGIQFDGTDDRVVITTSPFFTASATAMSISMWVFTDNTRFNGTLEILVDSSTGDPSTNDGFWVGLEDRGGGMATNGIRFVISTVAGDFIDINSNDDVIGASPQWYHIVVTYDGVSAAKIYINTIDQTFDAVGGSGNFVPENGTLYLGALNNNSFNFDGIMDEVIFYETALSAEEITQLYAPRLKTMGDQVSPTDRILDYRMDDDSIGSSADGVTITDYSKNGNDGTGDDGANNTGLTFEAGPLSYPGGAIFIISPVIVVGLSIPVAMHHYNQMREC